MSLHVLPCLHPLFPLYNCGGIIFLTLKEWKKDDELLNAHSKGWESALSTAQIKATRLIRDTHSMNYFEGGPIITYHEQVILPIPSSSSWNRDLQNEEIGSKYPG